VILGYAFGACQVSVQRDTATMSTRERPIDRGRRLAAADLARVGHELRTARHSHGQTLKAAGAASGISASQVARIERAALTSASVSQLARLGAAVGLDVRVRVYPGPDPALAMGQWALIGRLRSRLSARATLRPEVPLPIAGDQRAWDVVIGGLSGPDLAVDAETRLHDPQAQMRRVMLKLRDSGFDRMIWLVSDTRHNRAALRAVGNLLVGNFPLSARSALRALAAGHTPEASAIILL
jgi:transcriptional regulator with XRE-family HTH domain